jgi:hypothetical protein
MFDIEAYGRFAFPLPGSHERGFFTKLPHSESPGRTNNIE